MDRPIRVLIFKVSLDSHDRGAKIATALRDAIYGSDIHQPAPDARNEAKCSRQEDVDVIGINILSGAHMTVFPKW